MSSSPILNKYNASEIFRNPDLETIFLNLETPEKIVDKTDELAKLVNTGKSREEPFSRWVKYREGYSPEFVQRILEMFPINPDNEYIFDPMCGSGSTQVAAQQLSISSAGTDVSPYAVLVSQVKTRLLTKADTLKIKTFIKNLERTIKNGTTAFSNSENYLRQYFPENNFESLIAIKRTINHEFKGSVGAREFLNIALLAIVEVCSNRKKDGNGLATRDSSVTDALPHFKTKVNEMLIDLYQASWLDVPSISIQRSALEIDESIKEISHSFNKSLGAIIFSPPYANSFDYYESYKLELLFGDFFTVETIRAERKKLIRSYRQMGKSQKVNSLPTVEMLIDEIMARLPTKEETSGVRDGRSRLLPNMLRGYFEDMQEFMRRSADQMPLGSYMAIIVDQSAYMGVLVPTDLILAEIAVGLGFVFEKLVICRRAKTSSQQMSIQPALGDLLRESAVILRR